jgi:uncharacterized protein (DUF983 family)
MARHVPDITLARLLYRGNSFNPPRPWLRAMWRGWHGVSPCCGHPHGLAELACPACGQRLDHAEFDGAIPLFAVPPAFAAAVMAILATDAIWPLILESEAPLAVLAICGLVVGTFATLRLHRRIAGALLGLQWALWMHGFDPDHSGALCAPLAPPIDEVPAGSIVWPDLAPADRR